MTSLNVGCGRVDKPGFIGVDVYPGAAHILADISHLPFRENSIDEVYASHVIEHVHDLRALMKEFHRVLRNRGTLTAIVPYGLRSLYDPFHLHAFDMDTFRFFTEERVRDRNERSVQSIGLFNLLECRLDSISQYTKFVPRLHHAYENGSALGRLIRNSQRSMLFRIFPKGRWPQLIVRMTKVAHVS